MLLLINMDVFKKYFNFFRIYYLIPPFSNLCYLRSSSHHFQFSRP